MKTYANLMSFIVLDPKNMPTKYMYEDRLDRQNDGHTYKIRPRTRGSEREA